MGICFQVVEVTTHSPARFALLIVLAAASALPQTNVQGQWSTLPYAMPINPVHAALLNNGEVLVVAGSGYSAESNMTAALWDPQSGHITTQVIGWDMFCNGMVILPDGRPLIDGGTGHYNPFYGIANAAIFDPLTSQFINLSTMANGRWYPTVTVLPDGTVLAVSGLNSTGATNATEEIFSPSTWSWSPPYAARWTPPLYPRLHVLPNGNVFYSGPGYQSRYYYPATHSWSGIVATTNYSANRKYGSSVLLPLMPTNNYKPVVMILGGNSPATATTELIDLSVVTPTWQWGPSMSQPRIEMNAVILPSGRVLALGGSASDEKASTASYNADLYDPATNTFSSAGKNAYPRLYHSVAMLLPDATVWLAGSNPSGSTYEQRMESYQPAYLFDGSGNLAVRPTIISAPNVINYGQAFAVQSPDALDIASVAILRAGAVTHAFDMEQRLIGLSYTVTPGSLNITAPPNSNIAPPGYYMLFVLNSSGVPSIASFIQLIAGADFSITPSPPRQVIVPGQTTSYSVGIVPSGGDGDKINLTLSGVPTGLNASFSNASVMAGGSTTLNFDSSSFSPPTLPQSYRMTLTGTGGALTRTAPVDLLVNSPGDFSLSAAPAALTLSRGGASGQILITLTPSGGFVGVTTFTVSGLSAHVAATFNPPSVISSGSTPLSITAGTTAATGTRTLTITGTSGTLVRTATVSLTVE